jgi:hypothetical protein
MRNRGLLLWMVLILAHCGEAPERGQPRSSAPSAPPPRPPAESAGNESLTPPKLPLEVPPGTTVAEPSTSSPSSLNLPIELVPKHESRTFTRPFAEEFGRFDAGTDGWDTEVFERDATTQLARLQETLHHPSTLPEALAAFVSPKVTISPLRPPLTETFRDPSIVVWRSTTSQPRSSKSGFEPLSKALQALLEPFDDPSALQLKTKVVSVEAGDTAGTLRTQVLFEASGQAEGNRRQQNAVWRIGWTRPESSEGDALPLIHHLEALSVEESASIGASPSLFRDVTPSVFSEEASWSEQLQFGIDHWRKQLERSIAPGITANPGLAIGDANGDGLEDVYLCQPLSLPNRLLIHQADGTVRDVAPSTGLDLLDSTSSALFLDLDNDGDQDLVVGGDGGARVFENQGQLAFVQRSHVPFPSTIDSIAAADYDGDSRVDFYICGHTPTGGEHDESVLGMPIPIYDAENGQPNQLIRNAGQWTFEDVTKRSGMDTNNRRFSYAAAWEDYDNDGDQDLYVANDFGRNNLYQNNGGTFRDVAPESGTEDISSGMSVSWADYNRDGWMDLYVGNMFSSAGNRVAYQRQFRPGSTEEARGFLRRMARGNSLFENLGPHGFRDVSTESGLTMGRWAWASKFVDINNDGWEDATIMNGFVTNQEPEDL